MREVEKLCDRTAPSFIKDGFSPPASRPNCKRVMAQADFEEVFFGLISEAEQGSPAAV